MSECRIESTRGSGAPVRAWRMAGRDAGCGRRKTAWRPRAARTPAGTPTSTRASSRPAPIRVRSGGVVMALAGDNDGVDLVDGIAEGGGALDRRQGNGRYTVHSVGDGEVEGDGEGEARAGGGVVACVAVGAQRVGE